MNYLLIYIGKIPEYVNYSIDSIIKNETKETKIYFCSDYQLDRNDIVHININDLESDYLIQLKKINYFRNEKNLLWEKSLYRIFYLYEAAKYINLNRFIHFDCDVVIYKAFDELINKFEKGKINITPLNELFLNFSYSFFDNIKYLELVCDEILNILKDSTFYENKYYQGKKLNEMILMNIVYIKNPYLFKLLQVLPENDDNVIFDPGSYGQYIGGTHNNRFSKKFINIDHYVGRQILKEGFKISFEKRKPIVNHLNKNFELANLHVHSKNLHKYV